MDVTDTFASTLTDAPHTFLQPSLPLYTDALAYLKHALDPLASDVCKAQQQRLQDARKKRKRGQQIGEDEVLRLKQIHTDALTVEQVWEQARRVIEAARVEAARGVENAGIWQRQGVNGSARVDEDELSEESESESVGEEGVDYRVEGLDVDGEDREDEDGLEGMDGLDGENLEDADDLEEDMIEEHGNNEPPDEFVADKFGLNDGFFAIDDFNRKSEFLEQQDARGDNDGAASAEEDVDWDTDPLGQGRAAVQDAGGEDGDDDEDGPTCRDPDASSEDEDDQVDGGEMDVMGGMSNTNDIMYSDFFAPPAQKKRKSKRGRPNRHDFPEIQSSGTHSNEGKGDMERTMAAVHRDLFEDDESEQEEAEHQSNVDPADPKSRRSTHERRKAALAEEIRKLEAANVAKREWTLSGEARAADRPLNSLLEEDLDFERAGKPVPVITAEVSESIEDLIKRRILAHDFQDISRRRPDDLATGKDARRGRLDFVLDDNKSKKGLADEYEEEHLRRTDPNFVDVKDEKLKKEEKEIEALWKKVCSDLDSLSSWHFRPKQSAPQLDIRVDAPAIGMEDARPSTGGEVAGASQLAPQEVYRGGEGAKGEREEVVGKSGLPAGKEEMSRDERKRRRRREKERTRKAGGNDSAKSDGPPTSARKAMLSDLKRGGVKVIGRRGDVRDTEGRNVNTAPSGQQGAGRYKL